MVLLDSQQPVYLGLSNVINRDLWWYFGPFTIILSISNIKDIKTVQKPNKVTAKTRTLCVCSQNILQSDAYQFYDNVHNSFD